MDIDIEKHREKEKRVTAVEKYMFFIGFVLPVAWFVASSSCGSREQPSLEVFVWKKRCRIAATLSLTLLIVIAAVIMVVNPKLFGLKTDFTGAQTSSASNSAIRPGVPLIGTNDWGDTIAGISIDQEIPAK